jgi:hypothetical protein
LPPLQQWGGGFFFQMKSTFSIHNWVLEQKEESVTISLVYERWDWYLQTSLQKSWISYMIGCPDEFESEAQANYWYEAAKRFLQGL